MNEGQVVAGKYRVEAVLGEGGMGRVVAAVHEQLEQRVAIKSLLPKAMAEPEAVERFLREARASVKLQSEHVGRVLDVGTLDDGAPYMVMEYLDGSDLRDELTRRTSLHPGEAVDYILQACEALAEAHAIGIIHRDIKPANLFLTHKPDGSPLIKVLDFGIAKAATSDNNLTQTQTMMGSPNYMAPEQLRSSRRVDARSDIWSLGVVLFELLCGRAPFEGEAFSDLCIMIATEPPAPLGMPSLAPQLQAAILRCLEKDPAQRFQNVAQLAAALEPFAIAARGTAQRISRMLQRRAPTPTPAPTSTLSWTPVPAAPPTPVPAAAPAPPPSSTPGPMAAPASPHPTTLSGAASEPHARPSSRRGGRLVAILAVTSLAGVAIVVGVTTSGADPRPTTTTSDTATTPASVSAPVTADAAPPEPTIAPPDASPTPAKRRATSRDKRRSKRRKRRSGPGLDLDVRR